MKKKSVTSDGGYLSVDRDEALKNNWELIMNMKRPGNSQEGPPASLEEAQKLIAELMRQLAAWPVDLCKYPFPEANAWLRKSGYYGQTPTPNPQAEEEEAE